MFMWFRKSKIKSEEYLEIKHQIELIWLEIDILTQRYKRKVKSKTTDPETESEAIPDGFEELRKIYKDKKT